MSVPLRVCRYCGDTPADHAGQAEPICSDGIGVTAHSYAELDHLAVASLTDLLDHAKGATLAEIRAELDRRCIEPPMLALDQATDDEPLGGPIDAQRRSLGERRLQEYMERHGKLTFEVLSLSISVATAPQIDYGDAALEAIRIDAADLRKAADHLATFAEELADRWLAQRQEATV